MRSMTPFAIALTLCFATACFGRDGGGGGGGGGTSTCMEGCERRLEAMCDDEPTTLDACVSDCEDGFAESIAAGCATEANVATTCLLGAEDVCDPAECEAEGLRFIACIQNGPTPMPVPIPMPTGMGDCPDVCAAQIAGGCGSDTCVNDCMEGIAEATAAGCASQVRLAMDCIVANRGGCESECNAEGLELFSCLQP